MKALESVRSKLTELANTVNTMQNSPELSEPGVDFLIEVEKRVEELTRWYDRMVEEHS